jgi:tetratricopeptide (TPR) repeat protein
MKSFMKKRGAILISVIILFSFNIKAQKGIDSLENLLNQGIEDSIRIQTLSTLAWKLKYKDANKAKGFAEEAFERSIEIGHKKEQARALQYLSVISRELGQYDIAIHHGEASIRVATETGDTLRISNSNSSLGLIYKTKGEYARAIPYFKKAATYAEDAKAFDNVTTIQNNIGHVYLAMSHYDSARIYYFEAVKRALPRKDSVNIQRSFNCIAATYMEQGDF